MATTGNAFANTPGTVRGHFLLHFHAAVYRLINYIHRLSCVGGSDLEQTFAEYPFLASYFARLQPHLPEGITWEGALAWWETEIAAWEQRVALHLPLRALAGHAEIGVRGRLALMLAGLVEEDSRFGTIIARLQEPLANRRPTLELVGQVMLDREDGLDGLSDPLAVCEPLLAARLLEVVNRESPRSEWLLRVPAVLWSALRCEIQDPPAPWCAYHQTAKFPPIQELILPDEILQRLAQVPALVLSGKVRALVLRGMQGSERLQALGAVARSMAKGVVALDGSTALTERQGELVGPLCSLANALPVLTYDLAPGETATPPALTGYRGPVGLLLGLEGGVNGPLVEKVVSLTLPPLRVAHRARHWQAALADQQVEDLAAISERFQLPGGHIRQAAALAVAHAALGRKPTIDSSDIRAACRALNRQLLDTLAVRLEEDGSWDRLVVSAGTTDKLRELERRCRHRERLLDHLGRGFGSTCNRGVRALFTGASGTGKTLAARILAAELGMDLYRVDLAAVVNKYIGETEKNLHRVLSRAEELDVILLLDEGDALLGSRTEVKSANDRYANLETNYLLQRLEHYQGIVVVTTNAADYVDNAFQRRMDVVVSFVPPQAQERWQIWQLHLPEEHAVAPDYLEAVAMQCAFNGGQIRNAALHAALLAVDEGGECVGRRHLEAAIRSEYRKAGATCPWIEDDRSGETHGGLESFLDALAP